MGWRRGGRGCCVGMFIKLFGVAVSASASAVLFVLSMPCSFCLHYKSCFYASAMNDFHELRLDAKKWQPVQALGPSPGPRFCHVASVHGDSMLVFGGYDGSNRLNDFVEFHFGLDLTSSLAIPPSTLVRAFLTLSRLLCAPRPLDCCCFGSSSSPRA